ncbi:MAG: NAD(+) diphosphatase [Caulobacterales bacterium]
MTNPNYFANYPLDRSALKRRDEAWLASALESEAARLAVFHHQRPFLMDEGASVGWLGGNALSLVGPEARALFLGVDIDGAPHFAVEAPHNFDTERFPLADMGEFADLRGAAMTLPIGDLAVLGCAKWLMDWHARNGFCAACGVPTIALEAGWKRFCNGCQTEHFPRVDPVVIMAVTRGDSVCLGRQKPWPKGMYSALAGFIEPGESIEDAVAREVLEESGLRCIGVRYHSTQPWPFPCSLMIGAICEVAEGEAHPDEEELEEVRWFTRDEAKLLIDRRHPDAFAPTPMAIAHQIIKTWANES